MQIDSSNYLLPAELYVISKPGSTVCLVNIGVGFDDNNAHWILGTPFLNYFYQVYDLERNQAGLAVSAYVTNVEITAVPAQSITVWLISAMLISTLGRIKMQSMLKATSRESYVYVQLNESM